MNRSAVVSIVAVALVAGAVLFLLSPGERPQEDAEGLEPLLLDVQLERLVRVGRRQDGALAEQPTLMQSVCQARFLARQGQPTSVFLPAGGLGGYALAFVPRVRRVGGDLEFRAEALSAELTIHWRDELDGAPRDDVWLYHSHESETLVGKVGDGIVIAGPRSERAATHTRADVQYRVILRCEGPVAEVRLEHVDWSIFRLDGEELHLTNTAIPSLMARGATVEPIQTVPDRPQVPPGQ